MIIPTDGYSWPSIHWWLTLNPTEQGSWASGLGTLAATFAAIGIAVFGVYREGKREAKLRAYNANLLAIDVSQILIELRGQINIARTALVHSAGYLSSNSELLFRKRIYLQAADSLPTSHALSDLPPSVAYALAKCRMHACGYNKNVNLLPELDSTEYKNLEIFGPWRFDAMLDEAQLGLDRAARELEQYVPFLSRIKWLERGDKSLVGSENVADSGC